jgi:HAD superfamily hydrolase (TIGR01509 family)
MSDFLPRTVLFDVDGTLIDSNGAHARSWHQALREHHHRVTLAAVRRLIGMGGDKLLPELAGVEAESPLGQDISARKKELFATALPTLAATCGARPLLETLMRSGVTIAVATSAGADEVAALLSQAGVDDLLVIRASKDDAARSKPDPDIVRSALARAGVGIEGALMVGDTPYDLEAANRAGIPAIALRCGGLWTDPELRQAVAIFDDPAALGLHWDMRPGAS